MTEKGLIKMSDKPNESLRIYFSNDFGEKEVSDITETFDKIIPTKSVSNAQIACDSVDARIVQTAFMTVLILVSGDILTGLFNSIGVDLKDKLAQVFRQKKKPSLYFLMFYKGTRIEIHANPETKAEWQIIWDTIDKAGKKAISEINNDNGVHGVLITYNMNVEGYWDATKY